MVSTETIERSIDKDVSEQTNHSVSQFPNTQLYDVQRINILEKSNDRECNEIVQSSFNSNRVKEMVKINI